MFIHFTITDSLRHMNVSPGEIVAIQGIGGLGHLAIQFSKAMGFRTVALSSSSAKKELALKLGASEYIDGSVVNQGEALRKMGGAKVVVCTAQSADVIEELVGGLKVGGQLLVLGFPDEPARVPLGKSLKPQPSLKFIHRIRDDYSNFSFFYFFLGTTPLIMKRLSVVGWPCGHAKDCAVCEGRWGEDGDTEISFEESAGGLEQFAQGEVPGCSCPLGIQ